MVTSITALFVLLKPNNMSPVLPCVFLICHNAQRYPHAQRPAKLSVATELAIKIARLWLRRRLVPVPPIQASA
jgi:hypothetical protein